LCQVFADFLGLTTSKYQYVVDAYERHEREQEQEARHEEAMQKLDDLEHEQELATETAKRGPGPGRGEGGGDTKHIHVEDDEV
jgi:hypothetical protein